MRLRLRLHIMLLLAICGLCGCYRGPESQSDEQKNEYFIVGKERAAARDYKGAIDAFQKAVDLNPRSALAHFELAVLYEQHGDQKQEDYISAMYHYLQAIKLRPNEYPAENARQRVSACKQELVKSEALAPVAQGLLRELDRLKEENKNLRSKLDVANAILSNRPPAQVQQNLGSNLARGSSGSNTNRAGSMTGAGSRVQPVGASGRTHIVKARDTLFSISRQYGVKVDALTTANPSLDPKRLKPGQVLNIPSL